MHHGPPGQRACHGPDRVEDQELPQGRGQPGKKSGLVFAKLNPSDRFGGRECVISIVVNILQVASMWLRHPVKTVESQTGAFIRSR